MPTMTDTLKHEEALFIPSESTTTTDSPKYTPKVEGEYLGHITEARTTVRDWVDKKTGNTFKARIYNFKVRVAPENAHNNYTYTDRNDNTHTTTGEPYVGWEVVSNGVFRFLEPSTDDTFSSNAAGNDRYLRFCQALGVQIKTTELERDGKTLSVQILPTLEPSDINGLPVTAVVGRMEKDWVDKEGKARPDWKIRWVQTWEDGTKLTDNTDNEIPF